MNTIISAIYAHAGQGRAIAKDLALRLPDTLPHSFLDLLAAARGACFRADAAFFTCGIVNAKSGACRENCSFCAQSQYHRGHAPVYPLVSAEALLQRAEYLATTGTGRMGIVTSGTAPSEKDFDSLCEAASRIRASVDIRLCASLGLLNREQGLALRQAGFGRYHHNLETAESYYPNVCTTHPYTVRVDTVRNAKAAGLEVCSGGIFGLGETWAHRIELAHLLGELGVDSIPVNFLMPQKGTPLEGQPLLPPQEALAIIAILRLMHPSCDIVVCGGREAVLREWGNLVLSSGANGIMVGNYLTTQGTSLQTDQDMFLTLGVRL
jgi:biotin synthetase